MSDSLSHLPTYLPTYLLGCQITYLPECHINSNCNDSNELAIAMIAIAMIAIAMAMIAMIAIAMAMIAMS